MHLVVVTHCYATALATPDGLFSSKDTTRTECLENKRLIVLDGNMPYRNNINSTYCCINLLGICNILVIHITIRRNASMTPWKYNHQYSGQNYKIDYSQTLLTSSNDSEIFI